MMMTEIQKMGNEMEKMTRMMEGMMGMMRKTGEIIARKMCEECLRDTVPEPEINQNGYVTPLKKNKPSESDCSGKREE